MRLTWLTALTAHALAALAWWWLMPGGFPVSNGHFWSNEVLPLALFAVALPAIVFKNNRAGFSSFMLLAAAWFGLAVALRAVFPITFAWLFVAPLVVGMILLALAFAMHRERPRNFFRLLIAAIGFAVGAWSAWVQKAPTPGTIPLNIPMKFGGGETDAPGAVTFDSHVSVMTRSGGIEVQSGMHRLLIDPLLTFHSRSPDGCWTVFAWRSDREGPPRFLRGFQSASTSLHTFYEADFSQTLDVEFNSGKLEIASFTRLDREIDSHLNAFLELMLLNARSPSIQFSVCGEKKIEVTYGEYPIGKPYRFAYLGADGVLHVVEATSAEKGPFHDLASGKLDRGAALTLIVFDGDERICSIELHDWSAQASTELSPTAGWGVPQNAIEFSKDSDRPGAAVNVFVSLANTSVGRGFDSVGHAPGTYRNRITVSEFLRAK